MIWFYVYSVPSIDASHAANTKLTSVITCTGTPDEIEQ